MSLISIVDDVLTINAFYIKSTQNKVYPIALLAYQQSYEFLSAAKQKFRTFKIEDFKEGVKQKLSKLDMVLGADYEFSDSLIKLSQKFTQVVFNDQQQIVKNISLVELVFISKIFFQIDCERNMINIQSNILSICNFQTEKVHTMYCKQIVQTTRQEGISFDILQNLLIQGHIKHRYSGISKNQDLFSIYNMPFPFSVQDIFSNDFYYKIDLERDKIIYLPPLNIWNEDDLINGLLQQKFIEGVRWSLIKPQLNIQHFYTTNQLLDIGLEAGDHASRQDRDSISQSTRYTTEQIASIQLRQQNQHRIAAHSAPSIESQLEKFPKIVQYLSRSRKEKFTFDIVDWNGEFVLYQRRPTKLIPVEKAKCEELLSQFSEVHFDQAKNICQEMLQKTLIKDSSKGKKKQKERKSQDKWLNDHLNDPDTDQWYLSSRQ